MDLIKQRQEREWHCGPHLAISEQRREVEEEGLAKRNCLNWVVKIFTFVKLYLESRNKARWALELKHDKPFVSDFLRIAYLLGGKDPWNDISRQAIHNTSLNHPRLQLHACEEMQDVK